MNKGSSFVLAAIAAGLLAVPGAFGDNSGRAASAGIGVRIKGTPQVGRRVSAVLTPRSRARGASYRWLVCWWTGEHCRNAPKGTHATYRIRQADVGMALIVRVRSRKTARLSAPTQLVVPRSAPTIAAAGDIACAPGEALGADTCRQMTTSDMILAAHPTAVLPLGDDQYECGRTAEFAGSYQQSWGRFKSLSHPVLGNHEYGQLCGTNEASPYFQYFKKEAGPVNKGWYSYEVGSWHLIALNSECGYGTGKAWFGACAADSPEAVWLRSDLKRHRNRCTLAYWHEPRFSSGQNGDAQLMAALWNILAAARVDVVLSGHSHDYERFDPIGITPGEPHVSGVPNFQQPVLDPNGIRQFVAGTGGKDHSAFAVAPMNGEVVRNSDTFGFLALTLRRGSYSWRFVHEPGKTFTDSGSASCH